MTSLSKQSLRCSSFEHPRVRENEEREKERVNNMTMMVKEGNGS